MFDKEKIILKESVDARKNPLADTDAWKLLEGAEEVIVGRGKKYLTFKPSKANKKEILQNCLGRTGNLRAPTLRIGKKIIVGFTAEMYEQYVARS